MKKNRKLSRKLGVLVAVCVAMGALTGCKAADESSRPAVIEEEMENTKEEGATTEDITTEDIITEGMTTEESSSAEEDAGMGESDGLDNFDVASEVAVAFAQKVQKTVADADMTELAEMMTFPNYVSIYQENGGVVNTKDEFTAIDADKIFTKEMQESVANADLSTMEACMAGFLIVSASDNAAPSITFGMVDGELKVTGINY